MEPTTGILVRLNSTYPACTNKEPDIDSSITKVARYVAPCATTSQCQTRYVRSVDPGIKRGPWSPEEDDRLRKAVAAFKNSWIDVAGVLSGRTNDQCRERWGEISADRGWKGDWSPEEDQMLLDLAKQLGNKWKAIGARIGTGRTGPHVSSFLALFF